MFPSMIFPRWSVSARNLRRLCVHEWTRMMEDDRGDDDGWLGWHVGGRGYNEKHEVRWRTSGWRNVEWRKENKEDSGGMLQRGADAADRPRPEPRWTGMMRGRPPDWLWLPTICDFYWVVGLCSDSPHCSINLGSEICFWLVIIVWWNYTASMPSTVGNSSIYIGHANLTVHFQR